MGKDTWDEDVIECCNVFKDENTYYLCYHGIPKNKDIWSRLTYRVGVAISSHPLGPWKKYEKNPDASAFSEVHALWEPPLVYLYHTLRYISRGPDEEDIGVQILATQIPFRLAMPVLSIDSLGAGSSSELTNCPPISLEHISDAVLTVKCTDDAQSKDGMRIHVRASYDGINYDTEDLYTFDNHFEPGESVSKTVELSPKVMFVKVLVENLSKTRPINNVKVTATLGS